jgi:uncharacterized protein (TIGR02996 family)
VSEVVEGARVTTEDDFQAALDASPEDWQTRLVFADWLQERGDRRAAGYRVLGLHRCYPASPAKQARMGYHSDNWQWWRDNTSRVRAPHLVPHTLPAGVSRHISSHCAPSRREAEETAVLAIVHLPAPVRARLLGIRNEVE